MIRRDYSDFVLREIRMLVRFLSKTVLHREAEEEEILFYDQTAQQKNEGLDLWLTLLLQSGDINEAENFLFDVWKRNRQWKILRAPSGFIWNSMGWKKRSLQSMIFPGRKLPKGLPISVHSTGLKTSCQFDRDVFFSL